MSGEREWEIGCPQTNALGAASAIDCPVFAQNLKKRQKRQADNREEAAFSGIEQLRAKTLYLIAADALQSGVANRREITPDIIRAEFRAFVM